MKGLIILKDKEKVASLIAELKSLAENEFELHRINLLEKDLTDPPTVEIVDDKHQRFNSNIYFKDSNGHYRRYIPLHRDVWQYYHGEIPESHCIHHIDENKANNDISNLQMMSMAEHCNLHNQKGRVKKICPVCGKEFELKFPSYEVNCCSPTCASKIRSKRKPSVEKICPICGKSFRLISPSKKQTYCSKNCAAKVTGRKKATPTTRTCPYCNKTFTVRSASSKQVCCSHECATKLNWQKIKSKTEKINSNSKIH